MKGDGIMFKIKPETKAKVKQRAKKVGNAIISWAPWLAIGTTISAAWLGCCETIHNSSEIKKIYRLIDQHAHAGNNLLEVVNNNVDAAEEDRKRIEELEKENRILMEKALRETNGDAA